MSLRTTLFASLFLAAGALYASPAEANGNKLFTLNPEQVAACQQSETCRTKYLSNTGVQEGNSNAQQLPHAPAVNVDALPQTGEVRRDEEPLDNPESRAEILNLPSQNTPAPALAQPGPTSSNLTNTVLQHHDYLTQVGEQIVSLDADRRAARDQLQGVHAQDQRQDLRLAALEEQLQAERSQQPIAQASPFSLGVQVLGFEGVAGDYAASFGVEGRARLGSRLVAGAKAGVSYAAAARTLVHTAEDAGRDVLGTDLTERWSSSETRTKAYENLVVFGAKLLVTLLEEKDAYSLSAGGEGRLRLVSLAETDVGERTSQLVYRGEKRPALHNQQSSTERSVGVYAIPAAVVEGCYSLAEDLHACVDLSWGARVEDGNLLQGISESSGSLGLHYDL